MQTHSTTPPARVALTCEQCGQPFNVRPSRLRAQYHPRFCSLSCRDVYHRLPFPGHFWQYVIKGDDCWLWSGATLNGYGRLGISGQGFSAHRVSYILHYGPISADAMICHTCDVRYPIGDITYRRCVNPAHLFSGSASDNTQDMLSKGRGSSQQHPERLPRGEAHKRARLTEAEVVNIRQRYAQGGVTQLELAADPHVSRSLISAVIRREVWRHIP